MARNTFQKHRHTFRFKTDDGQLIFAKAKVRRGVREVDLLLHPRHVERSIEAHGIGNTQTCSMAMCAKDQPTVFPHPFMGYIDWQYSRCYVVSKLDKSHLPSECYVYLHGDEIAKLNDTEGGQKKLLRDLEKHGPRTIHLKPMRVRKDWTPRIGHGSKDGSRTSRVSNLKGAHLRYAVAHLGGIEGGNT